jgi:large subunit ribosomal protein L31
MKPGIHPDYRYVVFQDTSSGDTFLTRSTIETTETTTWSDGNEYPLAKVEISAFTHPFFTGQMKIVDTAGRVERFERRYGRRKGKAGGDEAAGAEDAGADTAADDAGETDSE